MARTTQIARRRGTGRIAGQLPHTQVPLRPPSPPPPNPNPLNDASPFCQHLETNYVPNAEELVQLRQLVATQQADLDNIDTKIKTLNVEISGLEEEKRPITHFLKKHNALMNPIRRLPLEVLQEIFSHCLDPNFPGSMHLADAPMVLTLVSKSWREAALRAPRLWSSAHIPIPTNAQCNDEAFAARLVGIKAWLARSRSLPLSLLIVEMSANYAPFPPFVSLSSQIFDVIYEHVLRWSHVHLVLGPEAAAPYFDIPAEKLPSLKSIQLQTGIPRPSADCPIPFSTLCAAGLFRTPTIQEINFTSMFHSQSFLSLPLRWSNLTSIVLGDSVPISDVPRFLNLFYPSNVLEKLRVEFSLPYVDGLQIEAEAPQRTTSDPIVTFPRLKEMAVSERVEFHWVGNAIRCPVLEDLEYHSAGPINRSPAWGGGQTLLGAAPASVTSADESTEVDDIENRPGTDTTFTSIVAHSGAFIRKLTFDPASYTPAQVRTALASCPNLEKLVMVQVYNHFRATTSVQSPTLASVNKALLDAFVTPDAAPGGHVLCPRLSTFVCNQSVRFSLEDFVQFLKVKQSGTLEGVVKLERAMVNFYEMENAALHDEVARLIPGGHRRALLTFALASSPSTSLRDGSWHAQPMHNWHSYRPDTYFGN